MANIENLRKIKQLIQTHSQTFNYKIFYNSSNENHKLRRKVPTDTRRYPSLLEVVSVAFNDEKSGNSGQWHSIQEFKEYATDFYNQNECGTTACVAGFCCLKAVEEGYLDNPINIGMLYHNQNNPERTLAKQYLDITEDETEFLFYPMPEHFDNQGSGVDYDDEDQKGSLRTERYLQNYGGNKRLNYYASVSQADQVAEALQRIDFIINHYENQETKAD